MYKYPPPCHRLSSLSNRLRSSAQVSTNNSKSCSSGVEVFPSKSPGLCGDRLREAAYSCQPNVHAKNPTVQKSVSQTNYLASKYNNPLPDFNYSKSLADCTKSSTLPDFKYSKNLDDLTTSSLKASKFSSNLPGSKYKTSSYNCNKGLVGGNAFGYPRVLSSSFGDSRARSKSAAYVSGYASSDPSDRCDPPTSKVTARLKNDVTMSDQNASHFGTPYSCVAPSFRQSHYTHIPNIISKADPTAIMCNRYLSPTGPCYPETHRRDSHCRDSGYMPRERFCPPACPQAFRPAFPSTCSPRRSCDPRCLKGCCNPCFPPACPPRWSPRPQCDPRFSISCCEPSWPRASYDAMSRCREPACDPCYVPCRPCYDPCSPSNRTQSKSPKPEKGGKGSPNKKGKKGKGKGRKASKSPSADRSGSKSPGRKGSKSPKKGKGSKKEKSKSPCSDNSIASICNKYVNSGAPMTSSYGLSKQIYCSRYTGCQTNPCNTSRMGGCLTRPVNPRVNPCCMSPTAYMTTICDSQKDVSKKKSPSPKKGKGKTKKVQSATSQTRRRHWDKTRNHPEGDNTAPPVQKRLSVLSSYLSDRTYSKEDNSDDIPRKSTRESPSYTMDKSDDPNDKVAYSNSYQPKMTDIHSTHSIKASTTSNTASTRSNRSSTPSKRASTPSNRASTPSKRASTEHNRTPQPSNRAQQPSNKASTQTKKAPQPSYMASTQAFRASITKSMTAHTEKFFNQTQRVTKKKSKASALPPVKRILQTRRASTQTGRPSFIPGGRAIRKSNPAVPKTLVKTNKPVVMPLQHNRHRSPATSTNRQQPRKNVKPPWNSFFSKEELAKKRSNASVVLQKQADTPQTKSSSEEMNESRLSQKSSSRSWSSLEEQKQKETNRSSLDASNQIAKPESRSTLGGANTITRPRSRSTLEGQNQKANIKLSTHSHSPDRSIHKSQSFSTVQNSKEFNIVLSIPTNITSTETRDLMASLRNIIRSRAASEDRRRRLQEKSNNSHKKAYLSSFNGMQMSTDFDTTNSWGSSVECFNQSNHYRGRSVDDTYCTHRTSVKERGRPRKRRECGHQKRGIRVMVKNSHRSHSRVSYPELNRSANKSDVHIAPDRADQCGFDRPRRESYSAKTTFDEKEEEQKVDNATNTTPTVAKYDGQKWEMKKQITSKLLKEASTTTDISPRAYQKQQKEVVELSKGCLYNDSNDNSAIIRTMANNGEENTPSALSKKRSQTERNGEVAQSDQAKKSTKANEDIYAYRNAMKELYMKSRQSSHKSESSKKSSSASMTSDSAPEIQTPDLKRMLDQVKGEPNSFSPYEVCEKTMIESDSPTRVKTPEPSPCGKFKGQTVVVESQPDSHSSHHMAFQTSGDTENIPMCPHRVESCMANERPYDRCEKSKRRSKDADRWEEVSEPSKPNSEIYKHMVSRQIGKNVYNKYENISERSEDKTSEISEKALQKKSSKSQRSMPEIRGNLIEMNRKPEQFVHPPDRKQKTTSERRASGTCVQNEEIKSITASQYSHSGTHQSILKEENTRCPEVSDLRKSNNPDHCRVESNSPLLNTSSSTTNSSTSTITNMLQHLPEAPEVDGERKSRHRRSSRKDSVNKHTKHSDSHKKAMYQLDSGQETLRDSGKSDRSQGYEEHHQSIQQKYHPCAPTVPEPRRRSETRPLQSGDVSTFDDDRLFSDDFSSGTDSAAASDLFHDIVRKAENVTRAEKRSSRENKTEKSPHLSKYGGLHKARNNDRFSEMLSLVPPDANSSYSTQLKSGEMVEAKRQRHNFNHPNVPDSDDHEFDAIFSFRDTERSPNKFVLSPPALWNRSSDQMIKPPSCEDLKEQPESGTWSDFSRDSGEPCHVDLSKNGIGQSNNEMDVGFHSYGKTTSVPNDASQTEATTTYKHQAYQERRCRFNDDTSKTNLNIDKDFQRNDECDRRECLRSESRENFEIKFNSEKKYFHKTRRAEESCMGNEKIGNRSTRKSRLNEMEVEDASDTEAVCQPLHRSRSSMAERSMNSLLSEEFTSEWNYSEHTDKNGRDFDKIFQDFNKSTEKFNSSSVNNNNNNNNCITKTINQEDATDNFIFIINCSGKTNTSNNVVSITEYRNNVKNNSDNSIMMNTIRCIEANSGYSCNTKTCVHGHNRAKWRCCSGVNVHIDNKLKGGQSSGGDFDKVDQSDSCKIVKVETTNSDDTTNSDIDNIDSDDDDSEALGNENHDGVLLTNSCKDPLERRISPQSLTFELRDFFTYLTLLVLIFLCFQESYCLMTCVHFSEVNASYTTNICFFIT